MVTLQCFIFNEFLHVLIHFIFTPSLEVNTIITPILQRRNWGAETLSDLPKVSQQGLVDPEFKPRPSGQGLRPSCGLADSNGNSLCGWNQPVSSNPWLELERGVWERVCVHVCACVKSTCTCPTLSYLKKILHLYSNVNLISSILQEPLRLWQSIFYYPF